MSDLIIVGASGLGKEAAWLARRAGFSVYGFLDDNSGLRGTSFYNVPVIGCVDDWVNFSECSFVIAVAAPRVKKKILDKMLAIGKPDFKTLIDPSVQIDISETLIGSGSIICAGTICTADVSVGEHCVINKLCSIGHDSIVESFSNLSPQVMLGGHSKVEKYAEVGAASLVRQGLVVGEGAVLGMGSVLTKNADSYSLYVGNPARKVRDL